MAKQGVSRVTLHLPASEATTENGSVSIVQKIVLSLELAPFAVHFHDLFEEHAPPRFVQARSGLP